MRRTSYVTTIPRALLAPLGAAIVGTLSFLMEIAVLLALRPSKLEELNDYLGTATFDLFQLIALVTFIIFAVGLLAAGTPVWWLFHRQGRREWYYAVSIGAGLCAAGFIAMVMWNPEWEALSLISFLTEEFGGLTASDGQLNAEGWEALVRGIIGIAIAGALAGLALWKIAYKRPQKTEAELSYGGGPAS